MLNKTKIIVLEVLDEKKYHEKIAKVTNLLEKNYNFRKVFKKIFGL